MAADLSANSFEALINDARRYTKILKSDLWRPPRTGGEYVQRISSPVDTTYGSGRPYLYQFMDSENTPLTSEESFKDTQSYINNLNSDEENIPVEPNLNEYMSENYPVQKRDIIKTGNKDDITWNGSSARLELLSSHGAAIEVYDSYEDRKPVHLIDKHNENRSDGNPRGVNESVNLFMESGADSMLNAFDVYFYDVGINNEITESPLQNIVPLMLGGSSPELSEYFMGLLSPVYIGVRVQSIQIPQPEYTTTQVSVLGRKVDKQDMRVNFKRQSTMSIRLDQNLLIADAVNYISGHNILLPYDAKVSNVKELHDAPEIIGRIASRMRAYNIRNPGLCMIVKMRNLQPEGERFDHIRNSKASLIKDGEMPFFIFERVKFLGSGDISFKSGASQPENMNISFIFRRMHKVLLDEDDMPLIESDGTVSDYIETAKLLSTYQRLVTPETTKENL